ncbi:hypothetical protein QEO94_07585 [Kingella negevensis]|uniref:hypothetical protein n=1 Tax=Kingella negevensis TaxID=1522312 RepID=UPI002543E961|nr:hypothetical protein [Kingella negevensis]WII92503.1 hypothetical protein QEO94_07585 [Kingella negevensis]
MNYVEHYLVQDLETFEFLCPDIDGGVTTTPYIKAAGKYDDMQDAIDAGVEEIDGRFALFIFYEQE